MKKSIMSKQPGKHNHLRLPKLRSVAIVLVSVAVVSILHALSLRDGDALWQAITLRLYYLPVIYAGLHSGMTLGFLAGLFAALGHFGVMQVPMTHAHGDHMTLQIEHHVEIPFLVLLGFITGALRDHERHEKSEKEKIKHHFGSYVSAEVRDDILQGKAELGGDEAEVTVLFADIRNFTSLSERTSAAEVVEMLNQYFSEMVVAITNHGGTVNKFIGDAIMAVFGAPKSLKNHAESAVQAAIEMQARLTAHNFLQAAKEKPQFDIGIGLHSGTVIIGNIGSETRKEYTVIGDTVNTASRVESLTKEYGATLIVTQNVVDRLESRDFELKNLASVIVKGRSQETHIYSLKKT